MAARCGAESPVHSGAVTAPKRPGRPGWEWLSGWHLLHPQCLLLAELREEPGRWQRPGQLLAGAPQGPRLEA